MTTHEVVFAFLIWGALCLGFGIFLGRMKPR
jgi:hypothetical protein